MEGELDYRINDGGAVVSFCTSVCRKVDIEHEEWSGILNALYDFNLNSGRWGVSLGAGIGIGIENPRYQAVATTRFPRFRALLD